MKRYLIFIALICNYNVFANTATDECQLLRTELQSAMNSPNFKSTLLTEARLKNCFGAKMKVTNAGDEHMADPYNSFMDNLHESTIDIIQIMSISDQLDTILAQINNSLKQDKDAVSAIKLWQFNVLGERFYAVVIGCYGDSYFITAVFMDDKPEIVLMSA